MSLFARLIVAFMVSSLLASPSSAQFESVGSLHFPTSARSAEAQQHFLRGVAILHSFGWEQAIEQFQAAQELEPDFAMAYWGETLCYNHPLFATSPDNDNPRAVLARLGSNRVARLAKAPTDREKGFLSAVEILWSEGEYDDRRVAYMERWSCERRPASRLLHAYFDRFPPFRTFNAPFDVSHRVNARRTCSPSPIPSRCLTRLRPAARSGSKRNECSRFGTEVSICRSTYSCKRTTSETRRVDRDRSDRDQDRPGIVLKGAPAPLHRRSGGARCLFFLKVIAAGTGDTHL